MGCSFNSRFSWLCISMKLQGRIKPEGWTKVAADTLPTGICAKKQNSAVEFDKNTVSHLCDAKRLSGFCAQVDQHLYNHPDQQAE